jgi:hypothetical protein
MINMDSFDGSELDRNNRWDNRQASEMAGIMAFVWEGKRLPQRLPGRAQGGMGHLR